MKKSNILIAMFAVIITAASSARAEVRVDFDGSASGSESLTEALKVNAALNNNNGAKNITPVPTLKEFLSVLRQEERSEFLAGMTLVDGRLASGGVRQADAGGKILRVNDLLKDVPVGIKEEFIEGMAFKDGLLVSAYLGGLRKVMDERDVKAVVSSLIPNTNARASMANSKSLCQGGTCDNATCCYDGQDYGCYDTFANSTCTSSCK
ncbi:MAG: hypothetical protein COT18_00915 [Elusimicrobia bacterium CG08_land_8_20_14_0_20_59_10]|nr:MAG: hypothetical protein COT18_00915 [Elusimicrobia bacterium CG08_land_8_20_14_0_20_59_10]